MFHCLFWMVADMISPNWILPFNLSVIESTMSRCGHLYTYLDILSDTSVFENVLWHCWFSPNLLEGRQKFELSPAPTLTALDIGNVVRTFMILYPIGVNHALSFSHYKIWLHFPYSSETSSFVRFWCSIQTDISIFLRWCFTLANKRVRECFLLWECVFFLSFDAIIGLYSGFLFTSNVTSR